MNIEAWQLGCEMELINYEANDLVNKIVSTDMIRDNFKVFKDVYENLANDEKFDLLHLLIKKSSISRRQNQARSGRRKAK